MNRDFRSVKTQGWNSKSRLTPTNDLREKEPADSKVKKQRVDMFRHFRDESKNLRVYEKTLNVCRVPLSCGVWSKVDSEGMIGSTPHSPRDIKE